MPEPTARRSNISLPGMSTKREQREAAEATATKAWVKEQVAKAPPLTPEQAQRLRELLRPNGVKRT